MSKVKVAMLEPLEIEFSDGTTRLAVFNMEAFAIFEKEYGNIQDLANTEGQTKPYEFGAKLLYSGMKVYDKEITLEEARAVMVSGGMILLGAVMESVIDNLTSGFDEKTKENFIQEVGRAIRAMTV